MIETSGKFNGDLSAIEEFAKSLRDSKIGEDEIRERIGEEAYDEIYKDKKKPKLSLEEETRIRTEGAKHDPLYFKNELKRTSSGLLYDEESTLQLIRELRANDATDQEIAEAIGPELFELLGKKKEKKEKNDDEARSLGRFNWFRK